MSTPFKGLGEHLGNLSWLSAAPNRSISLGNLTGAQVRAAKPPKTRAQRRTGSWTRAGRTRLAFKFLAMNW